jgi:hypothetical protein
MFSLRFFVQAVSVKLSASLIAQTTWKPCCQSCRSVIHSFLSFYRARLASTIAVAMMKRLTKQNFLILLTELVDWVLYVAVMTCNQMHHIQNLDQQHNE